MLKVIKDQIEWHRMKRIASAHPFFQIKGNLLSRSEVKKLLSGRDIPDGKEVIRQVRAELGMPEPVAVPCRSESIVKTNDNFHTGLRWRRGIVVLIVLLAVSMFFTMTDVGTALASNIYKVIVSIFDGTMQSQNKSLTDDVVPVNFSTLPAEFESQEEIAALTKRSIAVPGNKNDVLTGFSTHTVGSESFVILSIYDCGEPYKLIQTLHNDESILWGHAASAADDKVISFELPIGTAAYLAQMEDGMVYAEAYGPGYVLNVSSQSLSMDQLKEIMMNLKWLD